MEGLSAFYANACVANDTETNSGLVQLFLKLETSGVKHHEVTHLDFSRDFYFGSRGVAALCHTLTSLRHLQVISFRGMRIESEGHQSIAKFAEQQPSLRSLDVSGGSCNAVYATGGRRYADMLKKNTGIVKFWLETDDLPDRILTQIRTQLGRNISAANPVDALSLVFPPTNMNPLPKTILSKVLVAPKTDEVSAAGADTPGSVAATPGTKAASRAEVLAVQRKDAETEGEELFKSEEISDVLASCKTEQERDLLEQLCGAAPSCAATTPSLQTQPTAAAANTTTKKNSSELFLEWYLKTGTWACQLVADFGLEVLEKELVLQPPALTRAAATEANAVSGLPLYLRSMDSLLAELALEAVHPLRKMNWSTSLRELIHSLQNPGGSDNNAKPQGVKGKGVVLAGNGVPLPAESGIVLQEQLHRIEELLDECGFGNRNSAVAPSHSGGEGEEEGARLIPRRDPVVVLTELHAFLLHARGRLGMCNPDVEACPALLESESVCDAAETVMVDQLYTKNRSLLLLRDEMCYLQAEYPAEHKGGQSMVVIETSKINGSSEPVPAEGTDALDSKTKRSASGKLKITIRSADGLTACGESEPFVKVLDSAGTVWSEATSTTIVPLAETGNIKLQVWNADDCLAEVCLESAQYSGALQPKELSLPLRHPDHDSSLAKHRDDNLGKINITIQLIEAPAKMKHRATKKENPLARYSPAAEVRRRYAMCCPPHRKDLASGMREVLVSMRLSAANIGAAQTDNDGSTTGLVSDDDGAYAVQRRKLFNRLVNSAPGHFTSFLLSLHLERCFSRCMRRFYLEGTVASETQEKRADLLSSVTSSTGLNFDSSEVCDSGDPFDVMCSFGCARDVAQGCRQAAAWWRLRTLLSSE